ncbi:TetR/AcrR family transcriptional regulator [Flexibacterium corallicola]|uniref:TetR/AcrR family transcriptional regulator n=1 Tax=Flexibacterium corallicola TaxID=3037259 RepID=UPI00286EE039|nr:TetR/AcrR family transcriptional regulator [Pseudovibrio sp. M1P-2-3]
MARTKGSVGADTQLALINAAKRLIVRYGFEAMTLRQLAGEVGLQVGSIYRYMESKEALLAELMNTHMDQLITAWQALPEKGEGPEEQLKAFVAFHIAYHVERREDVLIANMELRALSEDMREQVVRKRRAYERNLEEILSAGMRSGTFSKADVEVSTFAILAMLTGVCIWYQEGGRLSVDEIIKVHTGLVLNGARGR